MKKITASDPNTSSANIVAENIEHLKALFPEAFTENKIDFEVLKQLLGGEVDEREEKYGLNWHGKRRARQLALTPSTGTLRPCPKESVDWDTTQNLMIEGDNLEVLKLLQKSHAGKVKLIYIDPPYNTGEDFVYSDDFRDNIRNYLELTGQTDDEKRKLSSNTEASGRFHTDWLNMMYPRLKLARNLLMSDGLLCVSIDDHEGHNVRCICDEIFGEEAFVGTLTWIATTQPDNIGRARFGLQQNVEYVFVYSKCARLDLPPFILESSGENPRYPHTGKFGACRFEIIERAFEGAYARPTMQFKILGQLPREGKQWQIGQKKARELEENGRIEIVNGIVKRAVYPEDEDGDRGFVPFWAHLKNVGTSQSGKAELTSLLPSHGIDTVKPVSLVQVILRHLPSDSVVLDFFAGSGTTGHAVMAQNAVDDGSRRHILVQLPEPLDPNNKNQKTSADCCDKLGEPRTIAELTKERLRRAANKVKEENPQFDSDLGFRVFKLDTSNMRAWEPDGDDLEQTLLDSIDHIKSDRSQNDILYELLLKLGLDLCVPIKTRTIAGKAVCSIGAGTLIACLDEHIARAEVDSLALGITELAQATQTHDDATVVFRDSAFEDDVAKTNMAAILEQFGLKNVRSL